MLFVLFTFLNTSTTMLIKLAIAKFRSQVHSCWGNQRFNMPNRNEPVGRERRKFKRFPVKEWAMVGLTSSNDDSHYTKFGLVIDISRGGLAFEHGLDQVPDQVLMGDFDVLDLFGLDGMRVPLLPFTIVYEQQVVPRRRREIKMNRCGLEFGRLSGVQEVALDMFLDYHIVRS
jgi:c-di-GMP-binding flagellar brake protein YcgR